MNVIADLHLHSKNAYACSKHLVLENLAKWGEYKGIDILGCADFTFPSWNAEINNKLEEIEGTGLYRLKGYDGPTRFMMTTEISLIYKQGEKTRRVHVCLYAPNIEAVNKITKKLDSLGNIKSDGRPILKITCRDLTEIALEADEKCLVVPAHIWTPWYSVFGSKSGFDTIEEAFLDMAPYIYAVETGLSSSVPMNWMLSQLDKYMLVSNSDAHSLENLGREANVFKIEEELPSYHEIYDTLRNHKVEKFPYSINFHPEEGKYHMDGCAKCKIRLTPDETDKNKGICPKCKRKVTVGVAYRVHELADRKYGEGPPGERIGYKSVVPLREIISEALGKGKATKTVMKEYFSLVEKAKGEFDILLNVPEEELLKITAPRIVEGIMKMRKGDIVVQGGYDGIFGTVRIWPENESIGQTKLF